MESFSNMFSSRIGKMFNKAKAYAFLRTVSGT